MKVLTCLLALAPTLSQALDYSRSGETLTVSGAVQYSDKLEFSANSVGIKRVILSDSPGGDISAAIEVGYRIREIGADTKVSGYCYSACAIAFLGGIKRTIAPGAILGYHGAVSTDPFGYTGAANAHLVDFVARLTNDKFPPALASQVFHSVFRQDLLLITADSVDMYINKVRKRTDYTPISIGVISSD